MKRLVSTLEFLGTLNGCVFVVFLCQEIQLQTPLENVANILKYPTSARLVYKNPNNVQQNETLHLDLLHILFVFIV